MFAFPPLQLFGRSNAGTDDYQCSASSNAPPDGGKENQDEVQELSKTPSSTEIDLTNLYKKIKGYHLIREDLLSIWNDRHRIMQDRSDQFLNLTNGSNFEAWITLPKSK